MTARSFSLWSSRIRRTHMQEATPRVQPFGRKVCCQFCSVSAPLARSKPPGVKIGTVELATLRLYPKIHQRAPRCPAALPLPPRFDDRIDMPVLIMSQQV